MDLANSFPALFRFLRNNNQSTDSNANANNANQSAEETDNTNNQSNDAETNNIVLSAEEVTQLEQLLSMAEKADANTQNIANLTETINTLQGNIENIQASLKTLLEEDGGNDVTINQSQDYKAETVNSWDSPDLPWNKTVDLNSRKKLPNTFKVDRSIR